MVFLLSIFLSIIIIYLCVIVAETIALKNPENRFSKWWRKHIIQFDENDYFN
jgi:hypothetical protein